MGGPNDPSNLFTEEELAELDRPTPTVAIKSPIPVSGDTDDLEFDLLGATSNRPDLFDEPTVVRNTVPPPASRRPPSVPPTPVIVTPPPVAELLPRGPAPISGSPRSVSTRPVSGQPVSARPSAPPPTSRSPSPVSAPRAPLPPELGAVPELEVPAAPVIKQRPASQSLPPAGADLESFDDSLDEVLGMGSFSLQNVVPETTLETDVPWPTGVTPEPGGLTIPPAALDGLAGYPEPPGPGPLQILYYFAVRAAHKELTVRERTAAEELERLERHRDSALAALAEALKPSLASNPRFEVLYRDAGSFERSAESQRGRLDARDHDLAERLKGAEAKIANARAHVLAQTEECQALERSLEEVERTQKRALALASRAQIEMRNLVSVARQRAPDATHLPPDLSEKYRDAEARQQSQQALAQAQEPLLKERRAALDVGLEKRRRLEADLGRILAEREALVMTYEGDMRALLSELDQSEKAKQARLADAGRALLRLRGEVPVDEATRRILLGHDEAVRVAARKLEAVKRAVRSYDPPTFESGKKWLIGSSSALALLLIWLILR